MISGFNIYVRGIVLRLNLLGTNLQNGLKKAWEDCKDFYTQLFIKSNLQDLAPIDFADEKKYYWKSLSWALNNENIKNVALTGSYGSGKSSVLRTFEKRYRKYFFWRYPFLHISLGTFKASEGGQLGTDALSNLEKSILQQIFYRVSESKLPNSRFKRINNTRSYKYLIDACFIVLLSIAILYCYKPNLGLFQYYINHSELIQEHKSFVKYLLSVLILGGAVLYIKDLLRWINKYSFWKINVKNAEIEVDHKHDSILNRYLDELLYFFERTRFKVVIIEDLDRFDQAISIEIFNKLREINTLINHSSNLNGRVVFVYAIKDETFTGTNRTKFFDLIVPVIPVIDRFNSREKFIERIQVDSLGDQISRVFLSEITLYIEDMRLLKNIFNEFQIYRNIIFGKTEQQLSIEKLLGLIVYKNKYPQDFALLNKNEGMVAQVFNNKKTIVQKITSGFDHELEHIGNQIQKIHDETSTELEQLRTEYVATLFKRVPNIAAVDINGNAIDFAGLLSDENFDLFIKLDGINIFTRSSPNISRVSNTTYKKIELEVSSEFTYLQRLKFLNDKTNGELERLHSSASIYQSKKSRIASSSLKVLLETNSNENFLEGDINQHELLKRLLRNGYIDESFESYISHFYPGSLTRQDRDFLLRVKNQKVADFEQALSNVEQIVDDLEIIDLSISSALNFDLLDYLLINNKYKNQLRSHLSQFADHEEPTRDFIVDYRNKRRHNFARLIRELCETWDGLWDTQLNDHLVDHRELLGIILAEADLRHIQNQDKNLSISNYILQMDDFFELSSEFELGHKLRTIIKTLGLRFAKLNNPRANEDLFNYIYTNNLYLISASNLKSILEYKTPSSLDNDSFEQKNLTTILNSGCDELIKYVKENLNEYVDQVYPQLDKSLHEDQKTLLYLLNDSSLTEKTKVQIIKNTITKVAKITDVADTNLWSHLLSANKIAPTWDNLEEYFVHAELEIDDVLINFLNQEVNYNPLSQKYFFYSSVNEAKPNLSSLLEKLQACNELSDASYEKLIEVYGVIWGTFPAITSLSEAKVSAFIKRGRLKLNKTNFDLLKTSFNDLYTLIIEKNFDGFMKSFETYSLDVPGIKALLATTQLTLAQKIKLINKIDLSFIDTNSELVRDINLLVVKPRDSAKLSQSLVEILIKHTKNLDVQVSLFLGQLQNLDKVSAKTLLKNFIPKIVDIFNNSNPTISMTENNVKFVNALERLGLISSQSTVKKGIKIYSKRK